MLLQRIALGQYSIPSDVRLSRACLDLLARIFVVHPKRRITLEQIQQHPWFVQNLPPEMQVWFSLHLHCLLLASDYVKCKLHPCTSLPLLPE